MFLLLSRFIIKNQSNILPVIYSFYSYIFLLGKNTLSVYYRLVISTWKCSKIKAWFTFLILIIIIVTLIINIVTLDWRGKPLLEINRGPGLRFSKTENMQNISISLNAGRTSPKISFNTQKTSKDLRFSSCINLKYYKPPWFKISRVSLKI